MTELEPALPAMVSRFEANLLEILRFFLGRLSVDRAQRHLLEACDRPKCLSRAAVNLVEDARQVEVDASGPVVAHIHGSDPSRRRRLKFRASS